MSPTVRRVARVTGRVMVAWVVYGLVAMVVSAPVAGQQAIAGVRFTDRLGTLPVEVSLAHNGVSTLETGILGSLYWEQTGTAGFGAHLRAAGPPEAGGTLASYVSAKFVEASAQFVNDPDEVARVYGQELRSRLFGNFLRIELWVGLVGGGLLTGLFRVRAPFPSPVVTRRRRSVLSGLVVGAAVAVSTVVAIQLFETWDGNAEVDASYPMPGISQLSFSSPQTLEVARQVQPFIEKNTHRIRERARAYETAADTSLRTELPAHVAALTPRDGERIVLAEADPQGSLVGTRVRQVMYKVLTEQLGESAIALRTISGDVTSNGSVAEEGFVQGEATASPDIPLVAVKGDHDTHTTVEQLEENEVVVPDFEATEVDGLQSWRRTTRRSRPCSVAWSSTRRASPRAARANLRAWIDADEPVIVLLHQPRSAAGYLGVDSLEDLNAGRAARPRRGTTGSPTFPPGSVTSATSTTPTDHGWSGTPTATRSRGRGHPARHLRRGGGEPDLQPVLHPVLGAAEDAKRSAAVLQHRPVCKPGRCHRHRHRRDRHHHRRVDLGLPGGQPGTLDASDGTS